MKEKRIGFIDLNKKELKNFDMVECIDKDGMLFKGSSKCKRFVETFCNKMNKADVYEIVIRKAKK